MSDEQKPARLPGPATVAIHGAVEAKRSGQPIVPPIVRSATFQWATPEDGELRYGRYGNPNQLLVGRKIAALEGSEAAVALGSGMGATAMTFLALAEAGDHIVASKYLYGATHTLLERELPRRGVETTFVEPESLAGWQDALQPNTRVFHVELPTNPSLRFFDPRPIAALAHEHGITVTCDATFASPMNFRGIEAGIDVIIHSATKYLGGHSDLIAGAVAGTRGLVEEVSRLSRLYGPALDPDAAWLLDRGMRTLEVRVARHNTNATAIAEWFETKEEVVTTISPGLPSHPDHAIAAELMNGFGGMVSIVLAGGGDAADRFLGELKVASAAPSLGGVETLLSQPRHTSHAHLSPGEREALGIPEGFVRISVGIENVEDLIADFDQALGSC